MTSNIKTLYDILVSWVTKFDFIDTCTVGLCKESGHLLIVFYCEGGFHCEYVTTQYELENMESDVLDCLEHYIMDKVEREYKIQEVGEE